MKVCLDVDYRETTERVGAVVFGDWRDARASAERVRPVSEVKSYESGQFYRRELPCLLAMLQTLPEMQAIVVDGYVWLDGPGKPGLGAHLHTALEGRVAVVGVAKTKFLGAHEVREVLRGSSQRPLYVSAVGLAVDEAAEQVRTMHGEHRIPTLLARVDQLCRGR